MRKAHIFILAIVLAAFAAGLARAQGAHPLSKASPDDWALYSVTADNATVPLMSYKDQQRWRVISVVQETGVRIDNYTLFGGRKAPMGGTISSFDQPFEPVFEISRGAKIDVVSSTQESLTVKGKAYACTKIVRKVSRSVSAEALLSGWNGTSTIWTCPDIPVGGVVRIENQYESQLTADSKPEKIKETWVLADFGFKNWKE